MGSYVWWAYRFCIDAEGAQKATNRDSWLRRDANRDRYRPPVADEIHKFPDGHPQSWTLDPWGLGLQGTNLSHGQAMLAKRREICNAITNDPPLIYRFSTSYKAEVILRDPEHTQDMEVDVPPADASSPATGFGGDVAAPSGVFRGAEGDPSQSLWVAP